MAYQGWNNPSSAQNINDGGNIAWTSPWQVFLSDDIYANATSIPAATGTSQRLEATGFNFEIPVGSTIVGIIAKIERRVVGSSSVYDHTIKLLKAGSMVGDNKAISEGWPLDDTYKSYGGEVDLWGTTWTAAEINASNFGIAIKVKNLHPTLARTARIDHVQIIVYYTTSQNIVLTAEQIAQDYNGHVWVHDCGASRPNKLVATASEEAGNLNGTYQYVFTLVAGNIEGPASEPSEPISVNNKKMNVTEISTGPGNITARRVYRTLGWSNVFYYHSTIDDNSTVTLEDNISDLILKENELLDKHGDSPPDEAHDICLHQSRMYYAVGNKVYWSDVMQPESCYSLNNIAIGGSGKGRQDVMAIYAPFEDKVVIFTNDTVYYLSVTGPGLYDVLLSQTNAHLGCCAKRTIKNVIFRRESSESDSYKERHHLVYLNKNKCLAAFDGSNSILLSDDAKKILADIHDDHSADCFAINDIKRHQYILFYPTGDHSYCDKWLVWDYLNNSFFPGGGMTLNCGASLELNSELEHLIVGQGNGAIGSYLYKFYDGNSHDGAAIDSWFTTKPLEQTRHDIVKMYRHIDVLLTAIGDYDLTVQAFSDYNNTTVPNKTLTLSMLNTGKDYVNQRRNLMLRGKTISLKFMESSTNPAWTLEGFVLAFQAFKRRQGA